MTATSRSPLSRTLLSQKSPCTICVSCPATSGSSAAHTSSTCATTSSANQHRASSPHERIRSAPSRVAAAASAAKTWFVCGAVRAADGKLAARSASCTRARAPKPRRTSGSGLIRVSQATKRSSSASRPPHSRTAGRWSGRPPRTSIERPGCRIRDRGTGGLLGQQPVPGLRPPVNARDHRLARPVIRMLVVRLPPRSRQSNRSVTSNASAVTSNASAVIPNPSAISTTSVSVGTTWLFRSSVGTRRP